jgi:predicted transcriptional regulator
MEDQPLPKPEIKKQSLLIEVDENMMIEVKGNIVNNEILAIWVLDKVKDMIKAEHFGRLMKAQQDKAKIITQENKGLFKGFVNRVFK